MIRVHPWLTESIPLRRTRSHEILTDLAKKNAGRRSVPALELDDVSFGVGHVDQGQFAGAGNIECHELADVAAAPLENFFALRRDVRDFERHVPEAGPRQTRLGSGLVLV